MTYDPLMEWSLPITHVITADLKLLQQFFDENQVKGAVAFYNDGFIFFF